ncbi:SixA phosphatase family protein [Roseivirga pacifica]|uniref:SixA phosphatase family protein n=1 Tax=Roseivirga pacifica TaxID=1267423 RepID=UPI003BAE4C69
MKRILLLAALCFSFASTTLAQEELTTFILVRHAEKGTDDARNPNLSEIGKTRAEKLKTVLASTEIAAIYSTPYKRTEQTVESIATSLGLKVQPYDPSNMDLVVDVLKAHKGKTVLVSGHSNTTPIVANFLLGVEKFGWLKEDEYDKIFIVTVSDIGKGTVDVLSY